MGIIAGLLTICFYMIWEALEALAIVLGWLLMVLGYLFALVRWLATHCWGRCPERLTEAELRIKQARERIKHGTRRLHKPLHW